MEKDVSAANDLERMVKEWEMLLPSWALRHAKPGMLELGAQLPTKDGRRHGNGHIIEIKPGVLGSGRLYYTVLTDAGQRIVMNSTEIYSGFYPPRWITDVAEVLRKFDRNEYAEPQ